MKKILFFVAIAAFFSSFAIAQEPDVAQIIKMRGIKADSVSLMLGKVYGTQAAMTHTTTDARQIYLTAFNDALNIDQKEEQYREGVNLAEQFFRNSEGVNRQLGINMSKQAFTQTFLTQLMDTTTVTNMNEVMRNINNDAKRLMEEISDLKKDSVAAIAQASLINIKADSLSQNMGQFFGIQMKSIFKKKNLSEQDIAKFIEGFNNTINVDENNKPLVDGRLLASDFFNLTKNVKKQLDVDINKDIFSSQIAAILNDPKVPTKTDFQAIDSVAQKYMKETQAFLKENSPEALTQKGLGKKYIEDLMEKDPKFIQSQSGLVYKILNPGNGKKFKETDKIKVMYKGTHVDGTTFDESKDPVSFAPNQVVPGFKEALLMMSPGTKMIAVLPYNLAYGERGAGKAIKPFETLVFEIETLGIDDSPKNDANPAKKDATKKVDPTKKDSTKKADPANKDTKQTKKTTGKKTTGKKTSKKGKK